MCSFAVLRAGIIPLVLNRDIGGPIGKSVSDVAKVFTALTDFSMFPNSVDPRSVVLLLECCSAGSLKQLYTWRPAGRGIWSPCFSIPAMLLLGAKISRVPEDTSSSLLLHT